VARQEKARAGRRRTVTARDAAAPPGKIRIIGGSLRRTPLPVADLPGLRPTPDRVRETTFNWLAHLLPSLDGASGLDLFAGTGALGLELASRGARRVVLVERDMRLAASLRDLAQRLAPDAVEVLAGDWRIALSRLGSERFDVVFLDPPFGSDLLAPALAAAGALLAPGGLVYAEDDKALAPARAQDLGMEVLRESRAGAVHFHLLRALPC